MPRTQISDFSNAAKKFYKKVSAHIPNPSPVDEDLILKLTETWDTHRTCQNILQRYLDENGTWAVATGNGSLRIHPMVNMAQNTLTQYLQILRQLEKSSGESLPEADALEEFFEG